jgi:hypothetical protein
MKASKPVMVSLLVIDLKNIVGQFKGVLTWMSKERAQLQSMIERLAPPRDTFPPSHQGGGVSEAAASHDNEHHEDEHGDPVISGTP